MMTDRLVSFLIAFGLGYTVLSSPYVNSQWAVIIAWGLVGAGAMVKIYLFSIAKKEVPLLPFKCFKCKGHVLVDGLPSRLPVL